MRLPVPAVAVLALALTPAAATAAPTPERGPWSGTATAGERETSISWDVVRRDGRSVIRRLHTTYTETCARPEGGEPVTAQLDVSVSRIRVKRDGTFRLSDGDVEVRGRFTARRRARGTIDVAPAGLTCAGATIAFRLAAVPMTCARAEGPGCAAPSRKR